MRSADAEIARHAETKTPPRSAAFWLTLALVPIAGETTADLLAGSLALGLIFMSMVTSVVLAAALLFQLHATRYAPVAYWATVCTAGVVGTLVSDDLANDLGIPLDMSTLVLGIATGLAFAVWFAVERNVDPQNTTTRRSELFYWITVACTLAFSTAAADLVTDRFRITHFDALLLLAATVAVLFVADFVATHGMSHPSTALYWSRFLLVPLLGGAVERSLAARAASGGVGLGSAVTCALAWVGIAVIVGAMTALRATKRSPRT